SLTSRLHVCKGGFVELDWAGHRLARPAIAPCTCAGRVFGPRATPFGLFWQPPDRGHIMDHADRTRGDDVRARVTGRRDMKVTTLLGLGAALLVGAAVWTAASSRAVVLPDPRLDDPLAATSSKASMVIAGGCVVGIEELYRHVRVVT